MNSKEIEETINRYNQRLKEFGVSEEALGWGKKGRAKLRYEILLSQWSFDLSSILDVGCGFGGLYQYAVEKRINGLKYFGIDINPNFINVARSTYPVDNSNFEVRNILENPLEEKYDFVLSSGIFNHKLENNFDFIKRMLNEFNRISRKGFAVNFLSNKVQFEYDYTYHADPSEILDLCYEFSNNVVLRNDYMPFEFTIFVNKEDTIDESSTVYNRYLKYI